MHPNVRKLFEYIKNESPFIVGRRPPNLTEVRRLSKLISQQMRDPETNDISLYECYEYEGMSHSFFSLACRLGDVVVLEILYKEGLHLCGMNAQCANNKQTALWLAVKHGHVKAVEFLFQISKECSLSINSASYERMPVTFVSSGDGRKLIPDFPDKYSYPVNVAAKTLDYETLNLLLLHDVDVTLEDYMVFGSTGEEKTLGDAMKQVNESPDSDKKTKCLGAINLGLSIKLKGDASRLKGEESELKGEESENALRMALASDAAFVLKYLTSRVAGVNKYINDLDARPDISQVFFNIRFLRMALELLCETSLALPHDALSDLVVHLIPIEVKENGLFEDEAAKLKVIKILGASSEFGITLSSVDTPAAVQAPSLRPC